MLEKKTIKLGSVLYDTDDIIDSIPNESTTYNARL